MTERPDERAVLDALRVERAAYVVRGRADRVAQVDAQIARLAGPLVPGPVQPVPDDPATIKPPLKRKTATRQITDGDTATSEEK